MSNEHCMLKHGYTEFEQLMTCFHCGKPLNDNRRVNELYTVNTTAGWAKMQLKILADMLESRKHSTDHGSTQWFVEQIRKIENGIRILND